MSEINKKEKVSTELLQFQVAQMVYETTLVQKDIAEALLLLVKELNSMKNEH